MGDDLMPRLIDALILAGLLSAKAAVAWCAVQPLYS